MINFIRIITLLLSILTIVNQNSYKDIPVISKDAIAVEVKEDNDVNEEETVDYQLEENNLDSVEEQESWTSILPVTLSTNLLEYSLQFNNTKINEIQVNINQIFPKDYTNIEGVITFRGNNSRTAPSYGISNIQNEKLKKSWEFITSTSTWGGGAGWTGQPVIVRWSPEAREIMNIKEEFINNVIQ